MQACDRLQRGMQPGGGFLQCMRHTGQIAGVPPVAPLPQPHATHPCALHMFKQCECGPGMCHVIMGGFVLKGDDGAPPLGRQGHLECGSSHSSKVQTGTASGSCST
jgi:hypothetical protein